MALHKIFIIFLYSCTVHQKFHFWGEGGGEKRKKQSMRKLFFFYLAPRWCLINKTCKVTKAFFFGRCFFPLFSSFFLSFFSPFLSLFFLSFFLSIFFFSFSFSNFLSVSITNHCSQYSEDHFSNHKSLLRFFLISVPHESVFSFTLTSNIEGDARHDYMWTIRTKSSIFFWY